MLTQSQIAQQMLSQLRLLDPSASAEIGTPERKIIDTVAQANADSQIDLVGLQSALDIDSKYGSSLDNFLAIFGFGRQSATYATGYVTFSRTTPSTSDIRIPVNSLVQVPITSSSTQQVKFYTSIDATLQAGTTSVTVPIRAVTAGKVGNVAANQITEIVGQPIPGITSVTNDTAITDGINQESDAEYKVRFKNTVFRNLAGTEDQYLALAIATAFTSKANVVGPVSKYQEYMQVPPVDDPSSYDVDGDGDQDSGGGISGEYTTALSTIPYAKHIYTNLPVFVSNGQTDATSIFYRPDVDFSFNLSDDARNRGDTLRYAAAGIGDALNDPDSDNRPNITLKNVYTGAVDDVQAIRPSDVILLEFRYLSDSSRNNPDQYIDNAVDVFIDGGNQTTASTVILCPPVNAAFGIDPASPYYYENYRRAGEPYKRPLLGNLLSSLYWQPVLDLPDQILIGVNTYYKGIHYWPVTDVSELGGTVRSRGGIEWSSTIGGRLNEDDEDGPYTGDLITELPSTTDIEIDNYVYDRNIQDLQASLDSATQITTDVLAHKATVRYFKLDLTVMYTKGASQTSTNLSIQNSVNQLLESQYYGSTIQLSDILQAVHNVPTVDNVRWSNDSPGNTSVIRVQECDINGNPLCGVSVERFSPGTASTSEIQKFYITGQPTTGKFTINNGTPLLWDADATLIQTNLRTSTGISTLTVTEDTRPTDYVRSDQIIRSFTIDFDDVGAQDLLEVTSTLSGGPTVFSNDLFLRDNELASLPTGTITGDTLPGLVIKPKAQQTWTGG